MLYAVGHHPPGPHRGPTIVGVVPALLTLSVLGGCVAGDAVAPDLAALEASCPEECIADGRFVGEFAAATYCDLSIESDGLGLDTELPAGPSSPCGLCFEAFCRERFEEVSRNYDDFTGDGGRDCDAFTEGEFLPVWLQARRNQCLYEFGDPSVPAENACEGRKCECKDRDRCDFVCDRPDCEAECRDVTRCDGRCGDGCRAKCKNGEFCSLAAGRKSSLRCKHVSRCELTCEYCEVLCRDVGDCDVRIGEGVVTCEDVERCNVTCAEGDRKDCGRGVYTCGGKRCP